MTITKYDKLSNVELLRLCVDKRDKSPIIEELCQRIEQMGGTCPVCEAELT